MSKKDHEATSPDDVTGNEPGQDLDEGGAAAPERADAWSEADLVRSSVFAEDDDPMDLASLKSAPSPRSLILTAAMVIATFWLVTDYYDEALYFFESREPVDLGEATGMEIVAEGDTRPSLPKLKALGSNRFVRLKGIPIRSLVATTSSDPRDLDSRRFFYQMHGAPIFIEEGYRTYRQRMREEGDASTDLADGMAMDTILNAEGDGTMMVEGRLIDFDADEVGFYRQLRNYFSETYDMEFCVDITQTEIKRRVGTKKKGGLMLSSENGGRDFVQTASGTKVKLFAVDFPGDGEVGFEVGGKATLLRSADGGMSWSPVALPPLEHDTSFFDVAFFDDGEVGFVVGSRGVLLRTTDSGATWEQPYPHLARDLHGVALLPDKQTVMITGNEGVLLRSSDRGATWSPKLFRKAPGFHDVIRTPSGALLACGDDGVILRSADGGNTWVRIEALVRADLYDLEVSKDGEFILAVGRVGTSLRSDDDGLTWRQDRLKVRRVLGLPDQGGPDDDSFLYLFDADFRAVAIHPDGKQVMMVGEKGEMGLSVDGGESIELRAGVYATSVMAERLRGGRGILDALHWAWQLYDLPTLNAVAWASGDHMFAVGDDQVLLESRDSGHTWSRADEKLYAISGGVFNNALQGGEGFAAALEEAADKVGSDLYAITFVDTERGFIGGQHGALLETRDGGESWSAATSPTSRTIRSFTVSAGGQVITFSGHSGLWGYWRADLDQWTFSDTPGEDTASDGDIPNYHAALIVGPLGVSELPAALGSNDAAIKPETVTPKTGGGDGATEVVEGTPAGDSATEVVEGTPAGDSATEAVEGTPAGDSATEAVEGTPAGDSATEAVEGTPAGDVVPVAESPTAAEREAALTKMLLRAEPVLVGGKGILNTYYRKGQVHQAIWRDAPANINAISVARAPTPLDPNAYPPMRLTSVAVGDRGTVLWSGDGGVTYRAVGSGTAARLYAVAVNETGTEGFIGGEGGVLLRGSELLRRWEAIPFPTKDPILDIELDERDAETPRWVIAAGHSLYLSDDQGATFRAVFQGALPFTSVDVDEGTGHMIAVGARGLIAYSADRGETWMLRPSPATQGLTSAWIDSGVALVGSETGAIFRSSDQGQRWTYVRPDEPDAAGESRWVMGIEVNPASGNAWAITSGGMLLQSGDSGQSWTGAKTLSQSPLISLFRNPETDKLWVTATENMILHAEGGERWSLRPIAFDFPFIYRYGAFDARSSLRLGEVVFPAQGSRGFAVGSEGVILISDDQGQSWKPQRMGEEDEKVLSGIAFDPKGEVGVAVGLKGIIHHTDDGGRNWEDISLEIKTNLFSVLYMGSGEEHAFLIMGQDGALYHYDAKSSPRRLLPPTSEDLRGGYRSPDGKRGFIVGGNVSENTVLCMPGYVIQKDERPEDQWGYLLAVLLIGGFGVFSAVNLIRHLRRMIRS